MLCHRRNKFTILSPSSKRPTTYIHPETNESSLDPVTLLSKIILKYTSHYQFTSCKWVTQAHEINTHHYPPPPTWHNLPQGRTGGNTGTACGKGGQGQLGGEDATATTDR